MARYLVALYRPDNYDPSREDEATAHAIDALNDEMSPPVSARSMAPITEDGAGKKSYTD